MRSVTRFRQQQNAITLGEKPEVPNWVSDETRERSIAIQLAEYEARKKAEAERIARVKESCCEHLTEAQQIEFDAHLWELNGHSKKDNPFADGVRV